MTAFGKGEHDNKAGNFIVEIQTLNRKFLEINVNFPKEYSLLEPRIRKLVSNEVKRGRVSLYLSVELHPGQQSLVRVNMALAQQIADAYRELKNELGLAGEVDVTLVAQNKDIIRLNEKILASEQYWSGIRAAAEKALDSVESMRRAEGGEIEESFRIRMKKIEAAVDEIDKQSDGAVNKYRDRLIERVSAVADRKEDIDERILQEIAIYAEKVDTSEELIRLRSHIKQFYCFCDSTDVVGRSLEFLIQEMNREVNTIGAKSSNVNISRLIVELKSELEKIREQVQNVE